LENVLHEKKSDLPIQLLNQNSSEVGEFLKFVIQERNDLTKRAGMALV